MARSFAVRIGCALLVGGALAACRGGTPEGPADAGAAGSSASSDTMLDRDHPSLVWPIEEEDGARAAQAKFVEVALAEVVNPRRHAMTFEVRYRPKDGAEVELGTFSTYPSDQPGTFIVATRGLLGAGGALVLSMRVADAEATDPVSARIGHIRLRAE